MSQFIAIGIATKVTVYNLDNDARIPQQAVSAVLRRELPDLSLFDEERGWGADGWVLRLKPGVMEGGLVDLMSEVFRSLESSASEERHEVLGQLRAGIGQWRELAESNRYGCLRIDRPHPDFARVHAPFARRIRMDFEMLQLSSEGKMIAECWYHHFRFFAHCIRTTYSHHALARALRVYFSG